MQSPSRHRHASTAALGGAAMAKVGASEAPLDLEAFTQEAPCATPPVIQSHKGAPRRRAAPGSQFRGGAARRRRT